MLAETIGTFDISEAIDRQRRKNKTEVLRVNL